MVLVCGVLTTWQKEIVNRTYLNSTRTHSQKVKRVEERLVSWLVAFSLGFFFWFDSVI